MGKRYFYYLKGRVTALEQVTERRAVRNSEGSYNVEDVINWFLSRDSMSPKKLQKLLYYAYSWTLTLENEDAESLNNKLFEEEFEAWVHGPVIPSVYHDYKEFGFNNITDKPEEIAIFDEDVEDILSQVWDIYGEFSGNELEALTHEESPWINARGNLRALDHSKKIISDRDIFECYGQRL